MTSRGALAATCLSRFELSLSPSCLSEQIGECYCRRISNTRRPVCPRAIFTHRRAPDKNGSNHCWMQGGWARLERVGRSHRDDPLRTPIRTHLSFAGVAVMRFSRHIGDGGWPDQSAGGRPVHLAQRAAPRYVPADMTRAWSATLNGETIFAADPTRTPLWQHVRGRV